MMGPEDPIVLDTVHKCERAPAPRAYNLNRESKVLLSLFYIGVTEAQWHRVTCWRSPTVSLQNSQISSAPCHKTNPLLVKRPSFLSSKLTGFDHSYWIILMLCMVVAEDHIPGISIFFRNCTCLNHPRDTIQNTIQAQSTLSWIPFLRRKIQCKCIWTESNKSTHHALSAGCEQCHLFYLWDLVEKRLYKQGNCLPFKPWMCQFLVKGDWLTDVFFHVHQWDRDIASWAGLQKMPYCSIPRNRFSLPFLMLERWKQSIRFA